MTIYTAFQVLSQNLDFKASAMKSYRQQQALMASVACMADAPTVPENIRVSLDMVIRNADENAYRQLLSEAKLSMIPMNQQISSLREAPLTEKRRLLDALPIIPVSIGAAFLGATEADLHDINSQNCGVFGDIYLRRRCNSMNELLLIAQNPGWMRHRPHLAPALMTPDAEILYAMTYVDIPTATGYTNMTLRDLEMHAQDIYRFHRCNFTYRVSDLEEIRLAKLKAQQQ